MWGCGHSSPDSADLWAHPTMKTCAIDSGPNSFFIGLSHQHKLKEKVHHMALRGTSCHCHPEFLSGEWLSQR